MTDPTGICSLRSNCSSPLLARPALVLPTNRSGPAPFESDGISFAPVLQGAKIQLDRNLFWRDNGSYAVRRREWKLVTYQGQPPQLFNLLQNPNERFNLSKQHPQQVRELTDAYLIWTATVTSERQ